MGKAATSRQESPASREDQEKPDLILRGARRKEKNSDEFETTVLLFKAKQADFLTGFVVAKGVKHQVVVHMNERKPDTSTGEVKPNFLVVSELDPETNEWNEIGYGNAINRRSDNKKVYFDEMLFNIGGELLNARETAGVDSELHHRLGFEQNREVRPKRSNSREEPSDEPAPVRAPSRSRPK